MVLVKIQKIAEVKLPSYAHEGDSGMDLFSPIDCTIKPNETKLVPTGIKIAVPVGFEAQVRPKSGIALKNSVTVLNTPGTVDAGYRGEIGVILINHGKEDFVITKGSKIAQLVICPVVRVDLEVVDSVDETVRGEGGFGSTGLK